MTGREIQERESAVVVVVVEVGCGGGVLAVATMATVCFC